MEKRVEGIILQMHKRRLEYADQRGGGRAKANMSDASKNWRPGLDQF